MALNQLVRMFSLVIVTCVTVALTYPTLTNPCAANTMAGLTYYTDWHNCSRYTMCEGRDVVAMLACQSDMAFDSLNKVCILRQYAHHLCHSTPPHNPCAHNHLPIAHITMATDCSRFHICAGNRHVTTSQCDTSMVFNDKIPACVYRGSVDDICSKKPQPTTPQPTSPPNPCTNTTEGRYPHPTNCAQYYDCSELNPNLRRYDHMFECEYPTLFHAETLQCLNYSDVDCGARKELKNPCEYLSQSCLHSHCIPCHHRHGDCTNLPNGLHPWTDNAPSYYFRCHGGRLMEELRCDVGRDGRRMVFDGVQRTCVQKVQG